jgi:acyl-homoserine-lactone acylase
LRNRPYRAASLALILAALIGGCSDSNNNNSASSDVPVVEPAPVEPQFRADIVWTEFGIPHITAPDMGGAGYGYGYSFAQLNYCGLMREIVAANGQTARYFENGGDVEDDFLYTWLNREERIQRIFIDEQREEVRDLAAGYVAGVNRYLAETGVDNLAEGGEGCRGAEWVRPITVIDLGKLLHKKALRGSAGPLSDVTFAAKPSETVAALTPPPPAGLAALAAIDREEAARRLSLPASWEMGSNGYGIGADASRTSAGLVLSNTHFPWQGDLRWNMAHVTVPGSYDVFGVALVGLPMPVMGFNKDLAWTHTVATGERFTFFELTLNPDNPLQYLYDGEYRDIEPDTVSIERRLEDGSIETLEHTFYSSHFGPMVDLAAFDAILAGWPNVFGTAFSYRDANLDNLRGFDMWLGMGRANDLAGFLEATAILGNPWTNTMAADRHGDAVYGDISVVPNVTQQKLDSCVRGLIAPLITSFGVTTLDGSDSACEWGSDEGAPEGILGFENLPVYETRDYGANANNSYWVPNASEFLEGYSPIIGDERSEIDFRARQTYLQAEQRKAGTDGLGAPGFTIDNLRELMYTNRNLPAEMLMDDIAAICLAVDDWSPFTASPDSADEACDILAAWDRRYDLDSVGSHLFYEWWASIRNLPGLFAVPFDPVDPLNTPRDLNTADPAVVEAVKVSLGEAVDRLIEAGLPMNAPWGELQFTERNGERIGVHGGSGAFMFNAIYAPLVGGKGYTNNFSGSSFIMATTWDATDCPDAWGVLTYSQSTDPASPHFADSTRLYSEKGWIDLPFCEADVEAAAIRRESIEE